MAGPYPQYPDPIPSQPTYSGPHPGQAFRSPDAYPQTLPPTLDYPDYPAPRRGRKLALTAVVLAVVGVTVGAVLYAVTASGGGKSGPLSEGPARTAIQGYLDALSDGDVDVIARNTLCGMYDAVRDRRSDLALAQLSSDTFRDQYDGATVTSIDKLVFLSTYQAQALFTMRVQSTGSRSQQSEEQGIAHLLLQDDDIFVCQYLLRSEAEF